MVSLRNILQIKILILLPLVLFIQCQSNENVEGFSWPEVKSVYKPGTYWWWMGSAVDKKNLTYNLKNMADVGIGNVHIIPIYGVKGEEDKYIDFLSPNWMDMLEFTVAEANKMGMNVDMSTTTGWPFGGSHIDLENAASKFDFEKISISEYENIAKKVDKRFLETVIAFSNDNKNIRLTDEISNEGLFNWTAPSGQWDIYFTYKKGTGQMVKRAAPGNVGLVLDPFSSKGLDHYLERYDKAFAQKREINLRAQYHDSYEYYNATWTNDFFDRFEQKNNYDLRNYLPNLLDSAKLNSYIKADYRRTLADFHLDYIEQWSNWSHQKGWITRNQAHGAPGNLLDLYAASDIPETETFGSRKFKIPGIRYVAENNSTSEPPNPLILKFASSAAHVNGKNLVASETGTWLREHYKSSLSQVKPEIDELFFSGINHVFYHGNAYSPKEAEWPGWMFYASTHFEKENAFWQDFSQLNSYVTRCQSILQSGKPANDILLYWPVEDVYHAYPDLLIKTMNVHDIGWFENSNFGKLAAYLDDKGYSFDYISDKQLLDVSYENEGLVTNKNRYKTILIPKTDHIPLETWKQLLNLAERGATIIFHDNLPNDVPGFYHLEERRSVLEKSISQLSFETNKENENSKVEIGKGYFLKAKDIDPALHLTNSKEEKIVEQGVNYIRRSHEKGYFYFFTNLSGKILDAWIPLSINLETVVIMDPRADNRTGKARVKQSNENSEVYLQLQPGESCILKTFDNRKIDGPGWVYTEPTMKPIELDGNWQVDFIEGAPKLPRSFTTDKLRSWTTHIDTVAKSFAGTARYTLKFDLPEVDAESWLLDLGKVCESAKIELNGQEVGTLWSFPFEIPVGKYLKKGENILEVSVTNLSANRLRDLDKRKVKWENFFFVNIFYKQFDASQWPLMESGLLGPVTMIPLKIKSFENN